MTANGWLQIVFFCARVLAGREAARHLPRRRCTTARCAGSRPVERADLPRWRASTPTRTSTGRVRRRRCCSSALRTMLLTYVVLRLQHVLPLNPQALRGRDRPAGVRDGGVVHDEHELAVVRAARR